MSTGSHTATVSIGTKHFIGAGSNPWLITGRIPQSDDDTAMLVLADSKGEAESVFTDFMTDDQSEHSLADLKRRFGETVYITSSMALD